jgi:site-specific DNA-methyltransferase (adenine-specific)
LTISSKFQADNYELFLGDCIEVLKSFPDDHFDFAFADPPYFLSNDGFSVMSGKQVSVNKGDWDKTNGLEADFQFHLDWLTQVQRVLKPTGTVAVSGTYHSIFQCGYIMQKLGFRILNDLVWFKPNAAPNLAGRNFAASHETIVWASKGPKAKHTFNYLEMKNMDFPEDKLKNPGKQMRSVWAIPSTPAREKLLGNHPTQKPLALLRRLILATTEPGNLVLDPFMGSGTTGVAAVAAGRRFIGIELDSTYIQLANNRLKGESDAS